jgi:MFS family permease
MHSYLELVRRNGDFRNLWLATVISYMGDWFNLLAAATLVASITESGAAVSTLFLARFLPLFFLSPWAGVLTDRYNRKRILILADLLRAGVVASFIVVLITRQVWLLYLLTVIQFSLSALFQPAHSAVLSNVVAEKDLVTANALDGLSWSVMLAVGALLGGIATALVGMTAAFAIDALSFLVSAWFISQIRGATRRDSPASAARGLLDFVDGLRYLQRRRLLLYISLVKAGGSLIWGAINVLEVSLARTVFPLGADGAITLSIFYAVTGVGSGLGPLLVRRWLGDSPKALIWAISLSFTFLALGVLGLGLAPTLPAASLAALVRTFGGGTLWVFSSALLQSWVDDRFRGRVFAFEFTAFTFTQSISTIWAGVAQDRFHWSAQQILLQLGLAASVLAIAWFVFYLISLRRLLVQNER